ncbi:site-specific DNA-methyltransferase [Spongiibacter nanhainus]|uniref:Site-specific DNA-methyltransferase n=1 Tax=Spongiibacter nanhainus TaxID=2794344 RepID=A0A7T4UQG3_9GAMM|nr:DNA methyltransferase [Spongiibacter nanhainus]QQD18723.1 site-specific DNA-methyltransferase [Spongiibacter nanhainus]
MSTLKNLLRQVESKDPQLAADLAREVKALESRRAFGLNFERHTPETVELPGRPIRRGDKVRFLPERGEPTKNVDRGLWRVTKIKVEGGIRTAELVRKAVELGEIETATRACDDLVVVAEFRDPIYPGLKSTGKIERGGNKPFHTVINAENYHALQALQYTHEGKVDAIYIDPPYNTRDKDWKYNNDYVDSDDQYKHSKWLAMMERRLKLAKKLLCPINSVLIATIDEKEVHRLGLLLSQVFNDSKIQMVTSLINPKGVARGQEFYRVEEYLFFVYVGEAAVQKSTHAMISTKERVDNKENEAETNPPKVRWGSLLRSGTDAKRSDRKHQFYPIFVNKNSGELHSIGEALLPLSANRDEVIPPTGTVAIWPIRKDGSEGRWQVGNQRLSELFNMGYASIGKLSPSGRASIKYVTDNLLNQIKNGSIRVTRKNKTEAVSLEYANNYVHLENPKTMWNKTSHSASEHGSSLVRSIIPGRDFPFPKSLYAVEDCLRFFVSNKPNAIILDFFSGSGTTAHAVMRLNKEDSGQRQCISITNNEVSADEQKELSTKGLRPGDAEWESLGICDHVTKPRIQSAITGRTPQGEDIGIEYRFNKQYSMADGFDENAEFFTLSYEAPAPVAHNRSFEAIAPLLWLKAGAKGRRIDRKENSFGIADNYAILFDLDASKNFLSEIQGNQLLTMAFIVTDDDLGFQSVCEELPSHVESVRLYESYLNNFTINTGRD